MSASVAEGQLQKAWGAFLIRSKVFVSTFPLYVNMFFG